MLRLLGWLRTRTFTHFHLNNRWLGCRGCKGGCHPGESSQGQFPAPAMPTINTRHRNGVRVLRKFVVEHHVGSAALSRLLGKETCGFDGWLMNIELWFHREGFRQGGLSAMAQLVPAGQVIWYDALTALNSPQLEATRIMADCMNGVPDIYSGIPCFGWRSRGALSAIWKAGTSVGLLTPGWTYEHFNGKDFETVDSKFWVSDGGDVEGSPVVKGFRKGWWIDGVVCSTPRTHYPTPCRADIKLFVW
ncbi:hypothetical protein HOY82DRAFT_626739 [Tuber indicum]|nr:hypothetical protein HOY82DRAFT_626739 [Tuber indicum]